MCAIKYWDKLKLVHIGLCKVRFGSFFHYNSRRELRVVEKNGLHIRDPEEILHIFDISYAIFFFEKFHRVQRPY